MKEKTISVAIKVLRPNTDTIIYQEMERLEWLTSFMENFSEFKRLRPKSIIQKAKEVIKFELDLRYEAAAASELSENTKLMKHSMYQNLSKKYQKDTYNGKGKCTC